MKQKKSSEDVRLNITQGRNVKNMNLKIERLQNNNFRIFIKWKSSDLFELFQGKIIINPEKWHNISINYWERGITFTQLNHKKAWDAIKINRKERKENRKIEKEEIKYKRILEQIVEILEDLR